MILVNTSPKEPKDRKTVSKRKSLQRGLRLAIPLLLVAVLAGGGAFYYFAGAKDAGSEKLIVYNWGDYVDPKTIELFEEETGISVTYEEYETNEIMYPKILSGAIAYDVVCPSDYMIQRMIENDLLAKTEPGQHSQYKKYGFYLHGTVQKFRPGQCLLGSLLCGYGGNPVQQNHGARTCGQLGYSLGF